MKILDAVIPIFGIDDASKPRLVGTGFLVRYDDHRLIASAAHVTDELSETPLLVPSASGILRKIPVCAIRTSAPNGNRELDKIDIAFWHIPQGFAADIEQHRWFLPTVFFQPSAPSLQRYQYSFVGYPHKGTTLIHRTTRMRAVPESFTGRCVSETALSAVGGLPDIHLAVEFDHNTAQLGTAVVVPKDRRGMSGGPVFAVTDGVDSKELPRIRVVGIAIEHHRSQRLLLATKIDSLLRLVAEYFGSPRILVSAATIKLPKL